MPEQATRWICFDVGETLIDETRVWSTWADILDIPRFTFMATFGAVIANEQDHRNVFEFLGRKDWQRYRAKFDEEYGSFQSSDLYPDAIWAIEDLRAAGYRISVIANQPARRTEELRAIGVTADVIAMSDEMEASKPAPKFYVKALELMGAVPGDVAYVGDRLDNDVYPSQAAGMQPVWLQRGPWAKLAKDVPPFLPGVVVVDSLRELSERHEMLWA